MTDAAAHTHSAGVTRQSTHDNNNGLDSVDKRVLVSMALQPHPSLPVVDPCCQQLERPATPFQSDKSNRVVIWHVPAAMSLHRSDIFTCTWNHSACTGNC
jgi:hypothetical protein